MTAKRTILITLVLTSLISLSYQLSCYQCTEGDASSITKQSKGISSKQASTSCNGFSDSLLVQCPSASKVCTIVKVEKGGKSAEFHDCGSNKEYCDSINNTVFQGATSTCYYCKESGCNSASGISAAASLLALPIIAAALLKGFQA